ARPGVIGVGIYVVWPAFFTNVTDSYRLSRAGRLRTDLGGIYFNAVFMLVLAGIYAATSSELLLLVIAVTHLEMLEQLLPFVRTVTSSSVTWSACRTCSPASSPSCGVPCPGDGAGTRALPAGRTGAAAHRRGVALAGRPSRPPPPGRDRRPGGARRFLDHARPVPWLVARRLSPETPAARGRARQPCRRAARHGLTEPARKHPPSGPSRAGRVP